MRLNIRGKLLIFALFVWAVIFGVYSLYMYKERIEQTHRMAITTARFLSREIIASRQFYTSTIVKRAQEAGLDVTAAYHDNNRSIPLPAVIIRELSDSLGAEGDVRFSLMGTNPINHGSVPKDDFQREALERFAKGLATSVYSFESYDGKESLRYMVPDVASSQVCVDCHNAHPGSARRDFRIGDVLGGLEIVVPIETEVAAAMADIWRSIIYGLVVVATMGLAGFAFIKWTITAPISNLAETTKRLSSGDLTGTSSVKSNDELGDLCRQTNALAEGLNKAIDNIRRTTDHAVDVSGSVRDMSRHVLEGSSRQGSSLDSISASIEEINTSSAELARYTQALAASIEKGSASALELGAGINEVVDNMESLSASVDDAVQSTKGMSFSIKEISENIENLSSAVVQVSSSMLHISAMIKEVETNATEASMFSDEVIRDARSGMETVEGTITGIIKIKDVTKESTLIINNLSEKIKEIGKILDVIRDVADETNLLALNAAIIAAQSGEYGKSFSVVANEIKDLAERTSTSAKEVSDIIGAVEIESERAVKAMERGVESVEEGVRLSMDAGDGLKKIVGSAQRSTGSVREIARASADQARESRMVFESTEKVAEMTRRIVMVTQEQARGSELMNKSSERMAEITYKVKGSARSQAEANKQITLTIDEFSRMVMFINNIIRELSKNTIKVLGTLEAVRKVSVENIDKAMEADKAVEEMASLNKQMMESVKIFKLKK